jgi:hypothetical protein
MDREPFIEANFKGALNALIGVLVLWCAGVVLIGLIHLGFLLAGAPDADWRALPIAGVMFLVGWGALQGVLKLHRAIKKRGAIYPPE